MIVGVLGYNATGSSALIGLLNEYNHIVKDEVKILELPDGILDLKYHINELPNYLSGERAI